MRDIKCYKTDVGRVSQPARWLNIRDKHCLINIINDVPLSLDRFPPNKHTN